MSQDFSDSQGTHRGYRVVDTFFGHSILDASEIAVVALFITAANSRSERIPIMGTTAGKEKIVLHN